MPIIDEHDARDDVDDQDGEVADPCGICGGELQPLGVLACQLHLRCRACGMQFNRQIDGCGDGGSMF